LSEKWVEHVFDYPSERVTVTEWPFDSESAGEIVISPLFPKNIRVWPTKDEEILYIEGETITIRIRADHGFFNMLLEKLQELKEPKAAEKAPEGQ